ncbi:hypothetical protein BC567DRAFT_210968 [Phyllosticta citribraziliensis]
MILEGIKAKTLIESKWQAPQCSQIRSTHHIVLFAVLDAMASRLGSSFGKDSAGVRSYEMTLWMEEMHGKMPVVESLRSRPQSHVTVQEDARQYSSWPGLVEVVEKWRCSLPTWLGLEESREAAEEAPRSRILGTILLAPSLDFLWLSHPK